MKIALKHTQNSNYSSCVCVGNGAFFVKAYDRDAFCLLHILCIEYHKYLFFFLFLFLLNFRTWRILFQRSAPLCVSFFFLLFSFGSAISHSFFFCKFSFRDVHFAWKMEVSAPALALAPLQMYINIIISSTSALKHPNTQMQPLFPIFYLQAF